MFEEQPLITITTDFGERDGFVGAMKGVILTLNPKARLVDIAHQVPRQDIYAGAVTLQTACPQFPVGTIHLAVIDPGVGSSRSAMIAKTDSGIYVLPDNGLISLVETVQPVRAAFRVSRFTWLERPPSHTFHGRDVFAPLAGLLSLGEDIEQLGEPMTSWVRLPEATCQQSDRGWHGQITYIDGYGNCITNLPGNLEQDAYKLTVKGQQLKGPKPYYAAVNHGESLFVTGSSETIEIAVNGGDAAARLELEVGDTVFLAKD